MWRLILVTFAFMGWAFYELSGGSDYEPGSQSLQAYAQYGSVRPVARPDPVTTTLLAESTVAEPVAETFTTLATFEPEPEEPRVEVTLAAVRSVEPEAEITETTLPKAEELTQPDLNDEQSVEDAIAAAMHDRIFDEDRVWPSGIELFARADQAAQHRAAARADIRQVSGNLVNMRGGPGTEYEKVTQLTKGTEVNILSEPGNGWLELEVVATGETGWMADWLLTAPN